MKNLSAIIIYLLGLAFSALLIFQPVDVSCHTAEIVDMLYSENNLASPGILIVRDDGKFVQYYVSTDFYFKHFVGADVSVCRAHERWIDLVSNPLYIKEE